MNTRFNRFAIAGLELVILSLFTWTLATAQVPVTTYQNDTYRSGSNTHESVLTPANVNTQSFGRKQVFPVQGFVYAEPLYLPGLNINGTSHNVLFVATEHDQVYAFDVNSGQQLWHTNFLASPTVQLIINTVSSGDVSCGDLVPEIGITGTPVIDPSSKVMYVVAKTKEQNLVTHTTNFFLTLHMLDLTNGRDVITPKRITAVTHGSGTGSVGGVLTFDPRIQTDRSALLLQNGQIFVASASHCDLGNYHGYLFAFDKNNLAQNAVWVASPNGYEGGFWAGGSGPAADSSGAIYAGSGNGDFDVNEGGIDFGDSVLRFTYSAGALTVTDYFTPWDYQSLADNDTDLGSGGVVLLPDQPGSHYPHLLAQIGKEGTIDLVNRDNMGHWHSGNDNQIVQTLPFEIAGIWGAPAFWNNTLYVGGSGDHVKAFPFNPTTQKLATSATSSSPEYFGFPGPTPAISSNGSTNGIVWAVKADTYGGGAAALFAYDATNLGSELYSSNQNTQRDSPGLAIKFTVPMIADGRVFVAAENQVAMYGLLGH